LQGVVIPYWFGMKMVLDTLMILRLFSFPNNTYSFIEGRHLEDRDAKSMPSDHLNTVYKCPEAHDWAWQRSTPRKVARIE
jgi:hypothetical protein